MTTRQKVISANDGASPPKTTHRPEDAQQCGHNVVHPRPFGRDNTRKRAIEAVLALGKGAEALLVLPPACVLWPAGDGRKENDSADDDDIVVDKAKASAWPRARRRSTCGRAASVAISTPQALRFQGASIKHKEQPALSLPQITCNQRRVIIDDSRRLTGGSVSADNAQLHAEALRRSRRGRRGGGGGGRAPAHAEGVGRPSRRRAPRRARRDLRLRRR
jgi:hypothetical protein